MQQESFGEQKEEEHKTNGGGGECSADVCFQNIHGLCVLKIRDLLIMMLYCIALEQAQKSILRLQNA